MNITSKARLTITVVVMAIVIFIAYSIFVSTFGRFEWCKELDMITSLNSQTLEYELLLPKQGGYKEIRFDISNIEDKYLNISVKLSLLNTSNSSMHIVSHDYFVGDLTSGDEAVVFNGELKKLIDLYVAGNAPRISNSKEDKILVKIRADKDIVFSSPARLYAYAFDSI